MKRAIWAELSSNWGCPDLSSMLFLHPASARWISQQSKSEVPINARLRHRGETAAAAPWSSVIQSPIISFPHRLMHSERRCELYRVPQSEADGSLLKVVIVRTRSENIPVIGCWLFIRIMQRCCDLWWFVDQIRNGLMINFHDGLNPWEAHYGLFFSQVSGKIDDTWNALSKL